jgi:hypothetical protein
VLTEVLAVLLGWCMRATKLNDLADLVHCAVRLVMARALLQCLAGAGLLCCLAEADTQLVCCFACAGSTMVQVQVLAWLAR